MEAAPNKAGTAAKEEEAGMSRQKYELRTERIKLEVPDPKAIEAETEATRDEEFKPEPDAVFLAKQGLLVGGVGLYIEHRLKLRKQRKQIRDLSSYNS